MNHYLTSQFHAAVDFMVNIVEQRPSSGTHFERHVYLRDMRTVHANAGRQCGKTEYIQRRANMNDLAVFPNTLLQLLAPNLRCRAINADTPLRDQLTPLLASTAAVDRVYVDEPKLLFSRFDEDEFYQVLAQCGAKTFILLGE